MIPPFVARRVVRGRYLFCPSGTSRDSTKVRVVCAGFEECSPDYELQRRTFPYTALELIAGGEWELNYQGTQWRLDPGMIFTYGPGVHYTLKAVSSRGLRKYFLDLEGAGLKGSPLRSMLPMHAPVRLVYPRWVQDIIEQIIDTARLDAGMRSKLGEMLTLLLVERLQIDQETKGSNVSASFLSFERCREYLAANYLEIHDLCEVAKTCGVSQVHLCRLFRNHAGENPHAFITRLKMNHAAELIVRENVAIKNAAMAVGFPDPYHFSKVFKKIHGSAPSKFKRCASLL